MLVTQLAACASDTPVAPASTAAPEGVSLDILREPLGVVVRRLGAAPGARLCLMNGLEALPVGPIELIDVPWDEAVRAVAQAARCEVYAVKGYSFITAPAYANLAAPRERLLMNALGNRRIDARFGADTALHAALGVLTEHLDHTLVADQIIGGATSGEIYLHDAPVSIVLDALLRTARVEPAAMDVELSDDYVFLTRAGRAPSSVVLYSPAMGDRLEARINLEIPIAATAAEPPPMSQPLGMVLPALSDQLNIPIRAEPRMHKLPVSRTVMRNVRAGTALELLVRMWPLDAFTISAGDKEILLWAW